MASISSTVLDTGGVAPRERFALWREVLSATHEASLPEGSDPAGFSAFARGWHLGAALVIETRATEQLLSRSARAIRADQIDHYIVRLQRRGHWSGEAGDRQVEADVGSVMVLDLARPTATLGNSVDNVNVIVPRAMLDAMLPPFDMHGLMLHGAASELLRSYLIALVDTLPGIPSAYAPELARATCSLVAACLAPSRESAMRAQAPLSLARLAEVFRHIDGHIGGRDLSPETICKALGLPRSALDAVCEPYGGAVAMIQRRRLERVRAILMDPADQRRMSDIARQHGFVAMRHFSRAFRDTFGYSPEEARDGAAWPPGGGAVDRSEDIYRVWMRQLNS